MVETRAPGARGRGGQERVETREAGGAHLAESWGSGLC